MSSPQVTRVTQFKSGTFGQERVVCGGFNTPPPSHTHTLFWNLLVFWQNVSLKFSDPLLSVNLECFIIKNEMQNSISIQSRKDQTFTGDCTDHYDNNEYFVLKNIRYFTNDIIYNVCDKIFINEHKRWHENEATIPAL